MRGVGEVAGEGVVLGVGELGEGEGDLEGEGEGDLGGNGGGDGEDVQVIGEPLESGEKV